MVQTPIYMDNHATTRVDPRVLEAMLPFFDRAYGNPASTQHVFGLDAHEAVERARLEIARAIGASPKEIVFTSGATESNNLAIRGVAERRRRRGDHLISVRTEHKAVLDPLARLGRRGFDVTWLDVIPAGDRRAGLVRPEQVADAIRDDTLLVSVMLANNEIGAIQPIAAIGRICKERGVLLHTDATQAVGKMPVDVEELQVDLMSFSAHKIYGPKGIGALYVRRGPQARLEPQMVGGGQEGGRRSGTLNTPGIIGLAKALQLCLEEMATERPRLAQLRNRLFRRLQERIPDVRLNGPALDDPALRLPGNLNCCFPGVDGEALMMNRTDVAISSGSACTSASPEASHVLQALGLDDDLIRASLRFGLGRFNTQQEVDYVAEAMAEAVGRLRNLSSSSNP